MATPNASRPKNSENWPTKSRFIQALTNVETCVQPGDFLCTRFSGHGDRVPTIYKNLKTATAFDEVLCTLGEDIRSVEFGSILDRLVERSIALFVVLDCCHSVLISKFAAETRMVEGTELLGAV